MSVQSRYDELCVAYAMLLGSEITQSKFGWWYLAVEPRDVPPDVTIPNTGLPTKIGHWRYAGDAARAFLNRRKFTGHLTHP